MPNYTATQTEGIWKNVTAYKREQAMRHLYGFRKHNLSKKIYGKVVQASVGSFLR